jgi:hypothetical protein
VPGRSVEQTQPPATPCRCLPNQVAPCMLDATCALPSRPKRTSAHPRPFVQSRNLVRRTTSGISWPGAIGQIGWPMTARRGFQAKAKAADAVSLVVACRRCPGRRRIRPARGVITFEARPHDVCVGRERDIRVVPRPDLVQDALDALLAMLLALVLVGSPERVLLGHALGEDETWELGLRDRLGSTLKGGPKGEKPSELRRPRRPGRKRASFCRLT